VRHAGCSHRPAAFLVLSIFWTHAWPYLCSPRSGTPTRPGPSSHISSDLLGIGLALLFSKAGRRVGDSRPERSQQTTMTIPYAHLDSSAGLFRRREPPNRCKIGQCLTPNQTLFAALLPSQMSRRGGKLVPAFTTSCAKQKLFRKPAARRCIQSFKRALLDIPPCLIAGARRRSSQASFSPALAFPSHLHSPSFNLDNHL